jgi:hypothetical protein
LPESNFAEYDFDSYFKKLQNLPDEYSPIVISMPMHDINKGLHKLIRKFGFPLITAGNTSSPFFVDRFYDLATQFKHATSNSIGSQLFYCSELGMDYFLYGDSPKSQEGQLKQVVNNDPELELRGRNLFLYPITSSERDRNEFVKDALGIGLNNEIIVSQLRKTLTRELLRLSPYIFFQLVCLIGKQLLRSLKIRGRNGMF